MTRRRAMAAGFRHTVSAWVVGAALAALAGTASAQDYALCVKLEARLIDLERGSTGASPVTIQRYNSEIIAQQRMLNVARQQAARAGCAQRSGFLFFRPQRPAHCGEFDAVIKRLETDVQRLQGQRRNLMPVNTGANEGERRRILAMLGDNKCGPQYERYATQRNGGLFGFFFRDYTRDPYMVEPDQGFYGTYRTICVRSCDGFFWPISFSTVQSNFEADEQVCRSSCPGTEASLYVHRNPGEGPDEAVSLTGVPLSQTPNAFRFRNEFVDGCSCRSGIQTAALSERVVVDFAARDAVLADGVPADPGPGPAAATAGLPVPLPRNRPGNEPPVAGSVATITGMEDYVAVAAPSVSLVAGKAVRVVGPGFTLYRSAE